jgi:AcrR family transcriptional regulator
MGQPGSAIWNAMLDATEKILCDEGYGALTSRRVAECIGVKQRLVYYYFRTMDDLIVETFRRGTRRESARLAKALESNHPLREIWDANVHTSDVRLISELMALANHVEALRIEVKNHIEKSRKTLVSTLTQAMRSEKSDEGMPAVAVAIIATSVALLLDREAELGVRTGHAEMKAVINRFIADWDRAAPPAKKPRRKPKKAS